VSYRLRWRFRRPRGCLGSAAAFQSDRDESAGGASGCSFSKTTAAAYGASGNRLDWCNRRVQRRRPAEGTVRPRVDFKKRATKKQKAPLDLARQLRELLERHPALAWDKALVQIASRDGNGKQARRKR
jgi:hypothetical protein